MAPVSLFHDDIFGATIRPSYLAWRATTDPRLINSIAILVEGNTEIRRANEQVDSNYVVGGADSYVVGLNLRDDEIRLNFESRPDTQSQGVGPQLTDEAESNLAIAVQVGSTIFKRRISDLVVNDTTDPYNWDATIPQATVNSIGSGSEAKSILFDTSVDGIDYDALTHDDTPAPLEVGGTATLPGLTATGGVELVDPVPLLMLSDFDGAGLDTSPALALLVRGDDSGAEIWGRGPRVLSGSALLDGEFDLSPTDEPINGIRFRDSGSDYGSERISFHDNGPLHLGTYFSSGDGSDLTLWIQTGTGPADIAEIPMQANYDRGGGNFAIIDVPAQYQSIVGSIDPGDRFILAMTRVPIPDDLEIGGTATLPSLTAEGGVELSSVAPLEVGAAATMPGLTGEAGVAFSDAPPLQVGATATLPGLTATGGVELVDSVPLEIGGAVTLPGLTAEGGVEIVDGVVIGSIANQAGVVGSAFTMPLPTLTGGLAPYTFSATGLPTGLNVHAATGLVYGVPSATGTTTIALTVTDDTGDTDSESFGVAVVAAQAAKADRDFFDSKFDNTIDGILWTHSGAARDAGASVYLVQSSQSAYRSTTQIDSDYIESDATAFVGQINLQNNQRFQFYLASTSDASDDGNSPGPDFDSADLNNIGFAFKVDAVGGDVSPGDIVKFSPDNWSGDFGIPEDPYIIASPSLLDSVDFIEARLAARASTTVQSILVDTAHDNIDYENAQIRTVPTVTIYTAAQAINASDPLQLRITADHGGDCDTLMFSWTGTGGRFTPSYGAEPIWTPPNRAGDYTLTITVMDEDGNSVTASVVITVQHITLDEIDDIGIEIGGSHSSVLPEAMDGPGPFIYAVTNLPAGATFTKATRTLAWTPNAPGGTMVTYTATDTSTGLTASRSFLMMAHLPTLASYVVLVDWDGDKGFAHDNADIFPDVDKRSALRVKRGRNYGSQVYGRSVSGTLETRLVNYHGRYDKDSSTSVLAGLIVPRRRIIWAAAADSVVYRLWAGFLDRIDKLDKQGGDDMARLTGSDIIQILVQGNDTSIPYTASTTTGAAAESIVEDGEIDDDDIGDLLGSTTLTNFYQDRASPWRQLRAVEEAEGGFLWVSGRGRLFLDDSERRARRTRSLMSQMTLTDSPTPGAGEVKILPKPRFRDPLKDLANLVRARVRTWTVGEERELWRLDEEIALAVGDSIILRPQYMGSDSSPAVAEWVDPQPCEDYQAWSMTGGAGVELTGTLDVALVAGATEAALTITNEHATARLYVSLVKLRGKRLEEGDPVEVEVRDTDSIDAYGIRPYTIATSLLSAVMDAKDYADEILRLYAQPTRKGTLRIQANSIFAEALPLELSDRVFMTLRDFSGSMYVEAIGHALMPGLRHDMELTLSQVP